MSDTRRTPPLNPTYNLNPNTQFVSRDEAFRMPVCYTQNQNALKRLMPASPLSPSAPILNPSALQLPSDLRVAVAVGVVGLPDPRVFAHLLDSLNRLPAKLLLGLGRIRIAGWHVPWPPWSDGVRDFLVSGLLHSIDHVQNTVPMPSSEIVDYLTLDVSELVNRSHVTLGQVHHVDVVPYTCAIRGRVIIAEDSQLLQRTHSHLGDVGHQIVRDARGILADFAARVCPHGVEVPQVDHLPLGVGLGDIAEHLLDKELGPSVGVGAAQGEILGDWNLVRVTVDAG
mmetsp:Transcript_43784/g.68546  ORF Transcript_43784/g.68546 Transcript_43784/m.68546 type:complete len:284 (+) Transcript_43784:125-976(+)